MPTSRSVGKAGEGAGREAWRPPFSLAPEDDLAFDEAIERVEAARAFGIDPSLGPTRELLAELGHPERRYRCVQVAGTNGKTSTARYTAALLREEGHDVGLYTSPHLVSYTERVEINGEVVGEELFARGISWALAARTRAEERSGEVAQRGCTEFELLTVAALVMYALAGVDMAVLEVGLGGRWDATSAVETCACAITGIGLDHTKILGDTLEEIAGEKAAVIRPGNPCVLGTNAVRPQGVFDVMIARCEEAGVVPTAVVDVMDRGEGSASSIEGLERLPHANYRIRKAPERLGDPLVLDCLVQAYLRGTGHTATGELPADAEPSATLVECLYDDVRLDAPAYQAQNASCALALATLAHGGPLGIARARRALAACPIPGRFEVVSHDPLIVLDACHNPQSAEAFASAVRELAPSKEERPTLLLGCLADKDHLGIVERVAPLFARVVVTQSDSERAYPAADLASEVAEVTGEEPAVCLSAAEALGELQDVPFVCCGTITLIGQIRGLLAEGLVESRR